MASKHDNADVESRRLCDGLLQMLHSAGNASQRREAATCCSVGKPRLYFVFHEREKISVWPRWGFSDSDELALLATMAGLTTGSRKRKDSTWAHTFPLNIYVRNDGDLQRLLPIILRASEGARGSTASVYHGGETTALEITPPASFPQGGKKTVTLNAYERSADARSEWLAHFGSRCRVCDLDFGEKYGPIGRGFIHVHHLIPIASIGANYMVNPLSDLLPVCPNCHEMIHKRQPPFTIEELRSFIRREEAPPKQSA